MKNVRGVSISVRRIQNCWLPVPMIVEVKRSIDRFIRCQWRFLVKIWSMHNDYSVTTIDAKSNVCCVKFKPDSQYNIVFGTADHNLYYFDLRNTREPCNLLKGHKKAVSYARFLSNNEIVSASTDSQLRLWRVAEGQCLRTYRGHVNEKNFVGLAVSSGYIVCGSSSINEVPFLQILLTFRQ